jgi:hypothetical protein
MSPAELFNALSFGSRDFTNHLPLRRKILGTNTKRIQ